MGINVDMAIFVGFLVANLALGLWSSRDTKTITEYAIGNRNFSTATIAATIVATWVSGNYIFLGVVEAYTNGLNFIWVAALGDFLSLFLIGTFFAPRMVEFLGKLSIAEAMGGLYGNKVRLVTAISSIIGVCGIIAMQFKIAGAIFEYALGLPSIYGILSAAIVVTMYSALGGIRSVTFTDVIQFLTFGTVIPAIAYVLFSSVDNVNLIHDTLITNPLFDYKKVFDFSNPKSFYYFFIFIFFAVPAFNPAIFQRIAMAKDIKQVSNSFVVSSFACLLLVLIVSWIGILMLATRPGLEFNDVVKYLVSDHSYIQGFKGVVLAGVMAMIMSTVDSYINSSAVIFTHDFSKVVRIKFTNNELLTARIVSTIIGVFSLVLSLRNNSLLELVVTTYSLYMPIVTVPFIMTLIGFRSSGKSVLLGMGAGLFTVLAWDYLLKIKEVNSVPIGMIANLIVLVGSHYLLKQKGGWSDIKGYTLLTAMRHERKLKIQKSWHHLRNFSFIESCRKNCPKGESFISLLGLFVMVSAFISTYTLTTEAQSEYKALISTIYFITLFSSTALIGYPLWLNVWKEVALGVVWNCIMFLVLICFSYLMVLISNFAEIQLMVFMVNIIILSTIITWRWALTSILIGVTLTTIYYSQHPSAYFSANLLPSQLKIAYLLFLVVSALIAFLKPKQEYQELTEEQNNHLEVMIKDREEELGKAQELKHEFLRNLEHEVNTPLVGLTSLAPMVLEDFDRLSPQQMKKYVKNIVDSHERYKTLSDNLLDLSKLDSLKYKLSKVKLNLSEVIKSRLDYCRRLYLNNKVLEFATEIDSDVVIECDEHYITSLLDNLIINAIKYSKEGMITLKLHRKETAKIEFQIIDEGISIPKPELHDIFGAFVVSSKTRTPSGGRGIGLALCKKIAEVHGGSIRADSDGEKGAAFIVELPVTGIPETNTAVIQRRGTQASV